jgi:hypothetical protein
MSEFAELLTQQRQRAQTFHDDPLIWSAPLAEAIWHAFFPRAEEFIGEEFMDEIKESVRDGLATELRIHAEEQVDKALFRDFLLTQVKAIQEFAPEARFPAEEMIEEQFEATMEALESWMRKEMDQALVDALPSITDLLETAFIQIFKDEEEKFARMEKDFRDNATRLKQAVYARKEKIIRRLRNELAELMEEASASYLRWLDTLSEISSIEHC